MPRFFASPLGMPASDFSSPSFTLGALSGSSLANTVAAADAAAASCDASTFGFGSPLKGLIARLDGVDRLEHRNVIVR